jgi:hypothetical protein
LLKLLIDTYGRVGADDPIKVFQQHRTMHRLTDAISKGALTTPEDTGSIAVELDKLVRSHFKAEEERIFPSALKAHRGGGQGSNGTGVKR